MESIDKEDLFNSVKKYINTSDETSMSVMDYDDSGAKARKSQARKLVDGFCCYDELEHLIEEQDESIQHLDPQLLADLMNKVNVGKTIQSEVAELVALVCMRSGIATNAEIMRINEMQMQLTQCKLKMPIEQSQLCFITLLREFYEKLMRALKIPYDNNSKNNTFDKNMMAIENNILSQDLLGERLDLDQLNGLYVDLLSILDIVSKQPENSKKFMASLAKSLENQFTEAIWINKANDLKNSDSIMAGQIPLQKFQDFLRQAPRENAKAAKLAEQLEAMKEKHTEYMNAFKEVENSLDEKKLTILSSEQLKILQVKLQAISRAYKAVPYALKLDLKQKQQQIERIFDNIEWSISAKGILEERVESIQQLEKILVEQTQKELSTSQKLLIKDIQERIFAVKKSNTQLTQVQETVASITASNNSTAITKKFPVQLFIDLFDTYKDLNQYINLDSQLAQVEDYLKVYQDEEFSLLKLSKGWMNRINEEKLDLKPFKADMESIKALLKKSIFDWTKYEANIRGLELVLRVREILQTAEQQSVNPTNNESLQTKDDNILLLLGWKSVIELKEEIQLLESKDNFVLKTFEGKATLMRKIDEYLSVKSDLDSIGKRLLTVDRIDEMSRILNSTFINCPQEKQRLAKLRGIKDKIASEMREFEVISARKGKVQLTRIQEVLDLIKNSSMKMDEKKVQLERKIHIATQLIRMAKNTNHMDIEKLVEQYHNQTVDIENIEDIIRENKQVDKELDDFDVKLSYCYDDYEDLMELNQILAGVKPHFQRKRLLVLLQSKIFTLLTIAVWKQWVQKRQLFGFSFNSLKQILTQSEKYDEYIIINKNRIIPLGIFELTSKIQAEAANKQMKQLQQQQLKQQQQQQQQQQQLEEESIRRIFEQQQAAQKHSKNDEDDDRIYLEEEDVEDLLKGGALISDEAAANGANSQEHFDQEDDDRLFLNEVEEALHGQLQQQQEQEEQQQIIEDILDTVAVIEPAEIPVQVEQVQDIDAAIAMEIEKELESIFESTEDRMKRTQAAIIEERFEIDVSILKECRDAVRSMWDGMMAKVRLIRSIQTMADIEDFEQFPSKYAVGCVDLMDILIEQKILIQNRDAQIRDEDDLKRKIDEEQAALKEKQQLVAIINMPTKQQQLQQQQQQLLQQQQQEQQLQQQQSETLFKQMTKQQQLTQIQQQQSQSTATITTNTTATPLVSASTVLTGASAPLVPQPSEQSVEHILDRLMSKASMRGFSEKHKTIARTIARSMVTNPHYKDMHVDLIENTVSYVVRRIIQFRYSDSYVEEMLELFEELKNDFYSSESYRKDSFSFKSFNTMMKFQHAKLQEIVLQKKRKLNEELSKEEQRQLNQLHSTSLQQHPQAIGEKPESEAHRISRLLGNYFLGRTPGIQSASGNGSSNSTSAKKIIDHSEYMNLDFKFSNTQLKDPLIKELHRLMQSKETLVQFRKLQADLNRITGTEIKQDTKITRGANGSVVSGAISEEEEEEEDEDDIMDGSGENRRNGKSSVSDKSGKNKEQFSSDDEDETEQEIIQSHPSVIKYMRDAKVKNLIDPIRESEMDAFMEFCNTQLKQLYANSILPQMRIMYNPLTNDQEMVHEINGKHHDHHDGESGASKRQSSSSAYDMEAETGQNASGQVYDPESVKNVKNIYSLFEGKIHMRADATVPPIEVTCFVEAMEAVIKDCPVFNNGGKVVEDETQQQIIVQSGESEMLETKEYLIRSYQCETILSLFGSVESATEEGQQTLDSLAQDLKNRDRVSIAMWNTATKMYVFHKKLFERDHCNNRLQKKFALSSSELCFALIFKPVGLKQEQIDAIERIKEPKLYSQSPEDFLELQALKMAQKRETQEFKEARAALFADGQNKQPKFKKPLPKYRKDTLLKIYLPFKGNEGDAEDGYRNQQNEGNALLNILLKPTRTAKEVEKKLEEMNQSVSMQSFFRKPSTVKNSAYKEAERDVKAFFERRLNGKRTVRQSLNKLDMIRLRKLPEQTQAEILAQQAAAEAEDNNGDHMPIEGEDIFANLTGQIDNLQTTINKSMAKKSVTYSDQVQKYPNNVTSSSDTFSQQESFDYDGINDYSDETSAFNDITITAGNDTDDSVSPLREPEKPSTQAKSLSSFKKSAGKSILRTTSRFGQPTPSSLKISQSQDMHMEDFSQDEDESSLLNSEFPTIYNRSSAMEEDSSDDTTPKYSDSSISSVSQASIVKNRQKLLEFASILDQIKPSALKSVASLHKLSEMSKLSSIHPNTTFNSIAKQPLNSSSLDEDYDQEDYSSSSYSPATSTMQQKPSSVSQSNSSQQKPTSHIVNLQRFRNNSNNGTPDSQSLNNNNINQQRQFQQIRKPLQPGMPQFKKGETLSSKPPSITSSNTSSDSKPFQQRMFDNKENKPNLQHRPRPSSDVDGLLTPQLSLSKESYSKGSVESNTSYSGKRSFNTAFAKNSVTSSDSSINSSNISSFNPYGPSSSSVNFVPSSNPTNSKFSVSSFHSRGSDYSELTEDDEHRYEKTTPVIDKYMHNTFRNGNNGQQGMMQKRFQQQNQQQQQRPMQQRAMLGGNQQQYYQNQRQAQQQQYMDQNNPQRNMNKQSTFIYEQDNYQYNSKAFNKSISKSQRNGYTESDSEISSSSTSKVNENQLLDLRDQLDSLLSAIQHKKSALHIQ